MILLTFNTSVNFYSSISLRSKKWNVLIVLFSIHIYIYIYNLVIILIIALITIGK